MDAWKLNIAEYQVKGTDYGIKEAIRFILTTGALNLSGDQIYDRMPLVHRVEGCEDDTILLSGEEYGWLVDGIGALRGFTDADYEFIGRIKSAECISVEASDLKQ
jgi:hypothetical protein